MNGSDDYAALVLGLSEAEMCTALLFALGQDQEACERLIVRALEARARVGRARADLAAAHARPRTAPGPCTGPDCDHASHARPAMIP